MDLSILPASPAPFGMKRMVAEEMEQHRTAFEETAKLLSSGLEPLVEPVVEAAS